MSMHDLIQRYRELSHERRLLLERLLREEGLSIAQIPIARQPRDTHRFPLSFGQQRLWFPSQIQTGNPAYNMAYAARLTGLVDVTVMEKALNEIIRRHESLRTIFPDQEGQPFQMILPSSKAYLPTIDMHALPTDEREAIAFQLLQEGSLLPFDLRRGPLLRTILLRLEKEEYLFLLSIHHIVADGWSIAVFIREFVALYTAFLEDSPSPLPELPIQYVDFARWQQNWLCDEMLNEQIAYWRSQLAGMPLSLKLPLDHPRPALQTNNGARRAFALSPSLTASLKELSNREGVTLFMTLVAAFQTLLHVYTGEDDMVVGTDVANRNRVETEELIGFFSNQLVLRTDVSQNPPFLELLKRVRDVLLGAYAHQDLPFEKLVRALNPKRNLSYTPLFQVKIGFLSLPLLPQTFSSLKLEAVPLEGTAKFDIELSLWDSADGINGFFEYNTDLFDAATIVRMQEHFVTILQEVEINPEQRILAIPLKREGAKNTSAKQKQHVQSDDQFIFS